MKNPNINQLNIVCIAGVDFEPLWARTQQLMWRMPEDYKILYVETPISFLSPFKDASLWYKWKLWLKGVRRIKTNLYLYSPPPLFPYANRCRAINRLNQVIIGYLLRKVCRELNMPDPVLLTYLPNSVDLVGRLGEKLLVYDCVDEHSAFLGFDPETVKGMERELIKKSDLVFTTALPLFEDKKQYNPNTYMLRNAADISHFNRALDDKLKIPEDAAAIKRPVIGFIGRIKEWIDLDLIAGIARKKPEWSILMVGPVEIDADITRVKHLPNIYLVGAKSKEELPGYLKKFDVCLNPFRPGRLSTAVNPLKFYEYLASGKPIVSTPMPEMEIFADLIEIGHDLDSMIAAIEKALQDTPEEMKKRLDAAREHSWENRVKEMDARIIEALSKKM
jgi:glycosyltransferase involved in cell wall biosynthesis